MFDLQFDAHFKSDCVTEDEIDNCKRDIENIKLLNFIVYNIYIYIVNVILLFIPSGLCI